MRQIEVLLFLAIILGTIGTSAAQTDFRKGYIIRHGRDTTHGLISYREGAGAHKSCAFKASENAEVVSYLPEQISGYGFLNDRYYETKRVSDSNDNATAVFAEVLVRGFVSLYRLENSFAIEKQNEGLHELVNETTISQSNGKKVARQSNQHIATLNMLLFDCVEIREKISGIRVSEKNFTNLVQHYNECKGEHSVTYKSHKPWLHVKGGIIGGVNFSELTFRKNNPDFEYLAGTLEKSSGPAGGISLDFVSPRTSERLSLHVDIFYTQSGYSGYTENSSFFVTEKSQLTIDLKELKIPLGLRYTLPGRFFSPFVNTGMGLTFHLSSNSLLIRDVESNGQHLIDEREALKIQNNQFGFWGGLGTLIRISNKLQGCIEFRYEQTDGIGSRDQQSAGVASRLVSQVTNLQIFVGIRKNL